MKRRETLSVIVFSFLGVFAFGQSLPEPAFFADPIVLESEFPAPRYEPTSSVASFAADMWGESPDPFGIAADRKSVV